MSMSNYLKRSAQRFKRQAIDVIAANPAPSVSKPLPLFTFPADAESMIVGSDADYRASSTSKVSVTPNADGSGISFSGKTAADGYAALRSKTPQSSFFGTATWDVGQYSHLALKVRSHDNRKYFVNLQTDSYLETDLYQHRLFLRTPGEWEVVMLPFDDFTLTNNGQIQEMQVDMDKYRLKTVGLSILDRLPGKFGIEIQYIRAENV